MFRGSGILGFRDATPMMASQMEKKRKLELENWDYAGVDRHAHTLHLLTSNPKTPTHIISLSHQPLVGHRDSTLYCSNTTSNVTITAANMMKSTSTMTVSTIIKSIYYE